MYRMACVILLLIPGWAIAAATPPSATEILAAAKTASGGNCWDHVHSMHLEGRIQRGRQVETFQQLVNLHTGRWVATLTLGPFHIIRGFNGKVGWRAVPGGAVFQADTPYAERVAVSQAFRKAYAWWQPRRLPAARRFLGVRQSDGHSYDVIRMTPRHGTAFELWINARTHLVARLADHDYTLPRVVYYSDYRNVHGIEFPFRERVAIGGHQHAAIVTVERVQINAPAPQTAFDTPKQHLTSFAFADGTHKVTIPFHLPDSGDILVHVDVNGHPMRFAMDSGSGGESILTARAAAIAGVRDTYLGKASVVGEHRVDTGLGTIKRLRIGGKVTLHDEVVHVEALPHADIDGTLGADFFARFVVSIDHQHRKLTLMRPRDFKASGAGTPVPLLFYRGGVPLIKGSFDGFDGLFDADTGDGQLILMTPFAKAHKLFLRYRASSVAVSAPALGGGRVPYVKARGGTLRVGTVVFRDPIVQMSPSGVGFLANPHVAGIIGGRIFEHFVATFDYARHTLYLKPQS